jgi:hypothetical protein
MFSALSPKARADSVVPVSLPWKDDFPYATLGEMRTAGWMLDPDRLISVGGGELTLVNDGSSGSSAWWTHFATGISDYRVEIKVKWTGGSYASFYLTLQTDRHTYTFGGDGYYPNFVYGRDASSQRIGGYSPSMNSWMTFVFEKSGNTINLYWNDNPIKTDSEPDPTSSLTQISFTSGYRSTNKIDYISVTSTESPPLFDFAISASPASRTIVQGETTTYRVNVETLSGTDSPVSLELNDRPQGVIYSYSPEIVISGSTSTLVVTSDSSTPIGDYDLTISAHAAGGGEPKTISVGLSVVSEYAQFEKSLWEPRGWHLLGGPMRKVNVISVEPGGTSVIQVELANPLAKPNAERNYVYISKENLAGISIQDTNGLMQSNQRIFHYLKKNSDALSEDAIEWLAGLQDVGYAIADVMAGGFPFKFVFAKLYNEAGLPSPQSQILKLITRIANENVQMQNLAAGALLANQIANDACQKNLPDPEGIVIPPGSSIVFNLSVALPAGIQLTSISLSFDLCYVTIPGGGVLNDLNYVLTNMGGNTMSKMTLSRVRAEVPVKERNPWEHWWDWIGLCPMGISVTDPEGRKTGYDPVTDSCLSEISNSTYTGLLSEPQELSIFNPEEGRYLTQVFGIENGNFTLVTYTTYAGNLTSQSQWSGFIEEGQLLECFIDISSASVIQPRAVLDLTTQPPNATAPVGEGLYDIGTYASISTDEYVDIGTGIRYRFDGWTGTNGTHIVEPRSHATMVFMDWNRIVTACYLEQYFLAVRTDPAPVSPTPFLEGWFDANATVELHAPSEVQYTNIGLMCFDYWDIDGTPVLGNPIAVHMDAAHVATAHYYINATLDIDPSTLNLGSRGNWITAYIELYKSVDVGSINVSSILLNNSIPVDPRRPVTIGDYDGDGILDLMVKFDRAQVAQYILDHASLIGQFTTVALTVAGELDDGTPFIGSDTIRIVYPVKNGGKKGIFPI